MHHPYSVSSASCLLVLLLMAVGTVHAQQRFENHERSGTGRLAPPDSAGPVYVVPVDGTIDRGLARYIARATDQAEADSAAAVVYEIDTFGGLIAAADEIRKTILNTSVPTLAFINKNAASAGAMIAYAADRIVMVPGASMGAATAVQGGTGEKASEKVQSYTRGLMRSTAEANGRDPRVAEAMVDESIAIDGVIAEGQLLTLSSVEAERLGIVNAVYEDFEELRAELGLADREVIYHRATPAERTLRFFGGSVVQSILMLLMLGGLYFEMQAPGLGFPGAVATVAALLFFAPNYMLGLVTGWEIVLFLMGLVLLVVELFIIPGFGVAGIGGLVLVVGALLASLVGNIGFVFPSGGELTSAIVTMAVTMVLLVVLIGSLSRYIPRVDRLGGLVLAPELTSASGYTSAAADESLLGKTGVAITALRPAGTAEIDGQRVDVVTQGEFIEHAEPVRVKDVQGSRIIVTSLESNPANQSEQSTK
jgi:membrane-bound serine protease (ClpP class)